MILALLDSWQIVNSDWYAYQTIYIYSEYKYIWIIHVYTYCYGAKCLYRPVKMLLDLQLIATELKPPAIIQERGYKKHIKNVGA